MENNKIKNKTNHLRWFISISLIIFLFTHLIVSKHPPAYFHYLILIILLILGVADRFQVIKIPGFIELKDKAKTMDKKLDKVVKKIQQIQTQSVNVNFNPSAASQTSTSPIETSEPAKKKSSETKKE